MQQGLESIESGEEVGDNEVNIGLLNTSIMLHKMFAIILWSLFAQIRSEMTSFLITIFEGEKLHRRTHFVITRYKIHLYGDKDYLFFLVNY